MKPSKFQNAIPFQILINTAATPSCTSSSKAFKNICCFKYCTRSRSSATLQSLVFKMAKQNVAQSPLERNSLAALEQKLAMANHYAHEGVLAGAKAAIMAGIVTAVPTMASVRMLPWARAYLNHTAQALIISTVAGAAYFIVADKTVLATARKNSFKQISKVEARNDL